MITKGAAVGPYEILGQIGAGGMGEVWRARDRRIGRDVAIKVLPDHYDHDTVLRFEQEARAAGSLNHPGLVTIYDFGTTDGSPYIVMELLEGRTLRDILGEDNPTPLPPRKAVEYAVQIAAALSVAHEKGIAHRDLKPENLFVTNDRRVKILDFGLAKLTADAVDAEGHRRTSKHLTAKGIALGTPAYMSPEQVRGETVDHRTDIFSFGTVLYEMLSAKPAFERFTAVESMHSVLLEEPPPLETLAPGASPALIAIVYHCLEKNVRERFQSARDLAFHLQQLPEVQRNTAAAPVARGKKRLPRLVAAAVAVPLLLGGVAGGLALRGFRGGGSQAGALEFKQLTSADGIEMFPTLAPDGKTFAYVSSQSGNSDIYIQRVDGRSATNVTSDSPDDDTEPAFSPDGSQIAFRSERDGGGIFVMGATGESVIRRTTFGYNPSWSPDGARLVISTVDTGFTPNYHHASGGLWIVNVNSGANRLLFERGTGSSDVTDGSDALQPAWSPHGHRIAFWGVNRSGQRGIWTIDPEASDPRKTVVRAVADPALQWNPVWSPDGQFLYFGSQRNGTLNLWRIAIDEKTGVSSGEPELLSLPAPISGHYTFSRQGELAFSASMRSYRLLALPFDSQTATTGPPQVLFGSSQDIMSFEPSPDGRMMALTIGGDREDLFVANTDGSRLRQLTNDEAKDRRVVWSPDGRRLYFYSNRQGDYGIWSIGVDGSGLTRVTGEGDYYNPSISPDGRTVAVQPPSLVHLDRPLAQRTEKIPAVIHSPKWSPDGKRLIGGAFTDEGPRYGIALYTFATRRVEKVLDRGTTPQWLPDSKHVVFFENRSIGVLDVDTRTVVSAPFNAPPGVQLNNPVTPELSNDGSTIYIRQLVEQGDIWFVRLDEK